jgi:DNA-binding MarR family transcriptional regulator
LSDNPRLGKHEYEALAAFRYAVRQFLHASELRARAVGLTNQQYLALLAIKGFPGRDFVVIRELAERLQIEHHSAVGLANRLAAQDLVAREASDRDRRQVQLRLTRRGEEVLERLASENQQQLRDLEPQISLLLNSLFDTGGHVDSGN